MTAATAALRQRNGHGCAQGPLRLRLSIPRGRCGPWLSGQERISSWFSVASQRFREEAASAQLAHFKKRRIQSRMQKRRQLRLCRRRPATRGAPKVARGVSVTANRVRLQAELLEDLNLTEPFGAVLVPRPLPTMASATNPYWANWLTHQHTRSNFAESTRHPK